MIMRTINIWNDVNIMNSLRQPLNFLAGTDNIEQYMELSNAIEQASTPQQHDVFLSFFQLGDHLASMLSDDQKWAFYCDQFELVLQSIVNSALPQFWRRACYETLNKPLLSLQRIAKNNDRKKQLTSCYIKLNKEISTAFKLNPF